MVGNELFSWRGNTFSFHEYCSGCCCNCSFLVHFNHRLLNHLGRGILLNFTMEKSFCITSDTQIRCRDDMPEKSAGPMPPIWHHISVIPLALIAFPTLGVDSILNFGRLTSTPMSCLLLSNSCRMSVVSRVFSTMSTETYSVFSLANTSKLLFWLSY